jgi:hypothetical protein
VEWVLQGGPQLLPRQVSTCRLLGRPRRSCCHAEKGKGRQGKARDGRDGWDGMGSWEAPWLRAGQGRACLQRTPPASSCHTNPRKQQTTSQLGCTSPIPRCNGFPGTIRSDAAVVGSFRPISIRVAPATAVDRCSQCARGHAGSKTPQSRAKYLADPSSSLPPLPSPLCRILSHCCIAAIVSGRLGRAQDGGSCCGTRAGAFFLSLSDQQSFKQRSVASSVWRAW